MFHLLGQIVSFLNSNFLMLIPTMYIIVHTFMENYIFSALVPPVSVTLLGVGRKRRGLRGGRGDKRRMRRREKEKL